MSFANRLKRRVLPAGTAAVLVFALAGCAADRPPPHETDPTFYRSLAHAGAKVDAKAAQSMISGYRHNNGLSAVTLDPELMALAEHQATVMAARNKLDHNIDGPLAARLRKAGYRASTAAENISAGYHTLAEAFSGWRDSPPHRKNMLLPGATRFGIAAVYTPGSKYKVFWAMVIAKPMERRAAEEEPVVQVLR
ncbi:MAG TPA: CAP domain-containing protein [Xanthobacteraceae bacterium]|jgi:uncharacterized protein YkwD|nr:CAP domain-containing protein [Xanthobacteraceae bacterium]